MLTGLGGIAFTTLAAYAPASKAMRIAPLAALRPVADAAEQRHSSVLRLSIAGALTVVGVLMMAAAVSIPSLLVGMAGGAVSACGILLLTRTFLPAPCGWWAGWVLSSGRRAGLRPRTRTAIQAGPPLPPPP